MIVVDLDNNVVGSAPQIYRTNVNGERNLIFVNVFPERENGYFYIGTQDRDQYMIYDDTSQPDIDKVYKFYVKQHPDGAQYYEYVEVIPEPNPTIP